MARISATNWHEGDKGRKPLARFAPRRFRAYCVGAAKTGTTTIADAFGAACRARHEPAVRQTNRLIIGYLEGKLSRWQLQAGLIIRDQLLRLELESAHPLGYVAGVLAETFPRARFIVTIREPLAWLHSRLNFHYHFRPPAWAEYRDYFWTRRQQGYAPEEQALERYDLCSLDVYLSQYADHYRRVLGEVPAGRRLVMVTHEIDDRLPEAARFLGADSAQVRLAHSKRSDDKIRPLEEIDPRYVKDRIRAHCGTLMAEYFPERLESFA